MANENTQPIPGPRKPKSMLITEVVDNADGMAGSLQEISQHQFEGQIQQQPKPIETPEP